MFAAWAIGDLSEAGPRRYLDYNFIHPSRFQEDSLPILGGLGLAVAIVAIAAIADGLRTASITPRHAAAAVPAIALGALLGFTYRTLSAGTHGANIGGGLLVFFDFGAVPCLIGLTYGLWRIGERSDRRDAGSRAR
jgi:hypothetical protein